MRQGQQRLPGCATNSEYAEIRPDECKRRSENLLAFKTHETDSLKLQLRRLMRVELVRCCDSDGPKTSPVRALGERPGRLGGPLRLRLP